MARLAARCSAALDPPIGGPRRTARRPIARSGGSVCDLDDAPMTRSRIDSTVQRVRVSANAPWSARLAPAVAAVGCVAGIGVSLTRPVAVASTASTTIEITDETGQPLADAAVWLTPVDGRAPAAAPKPASIEQLQKRFAPRMSVVQSGAPVSFPNNDTVRHHVYSFSPAKTFELKLYIGTPPVPVVFDKPGHIVLGCNIHDRMVAWVQVVDTPWLGRSEADGRVRIGPMPPGDYRLQAFHPDQRTPFAERRVRIASDGERVALRIERNSESGTP